MQQYISKCCVNQKVKAQRETKESQRKQASRKSPGEAKENNLGQLLFFFEK